MFRHKVLASIESATTVLLVRPDTIRGEKESPMQLEDVTYLAEQSLRWMPEADAKGRFISGVTLYWERQRNPVVKCLIVDPDDCEFNLESAVLEQVLQYGKPDGFSVYRGINSPLTGEAILLAGAFKDYQACFFGAEFGGKILGISQILGKEVKRDVSEASTFIEETLFDLVEPVLSASEV